MPPTAAMRGHDTLDMRVRFKPAALIIALVFLAVAYALAQLPPIGRRPVFGYMSSFAIVIGGGVPGAGDHVWPGAHRPGGAAAAAGRRRPARARQPDVGDSAAVDLGGGAVGQPGDDGRDRGDDRQLPRHGRLLGRADAEGRPVHRPRHPADGRLRADGLRGRDRDGSRRIPQVAALDRFRNVDLVYEGNLAVLGAGSYDVVLDHGGLLFKSPGNAREEVRQAIGQDTVIVSEPFATRYHKRDGDTIEHADAARRASRSASRRSTTTTPAIAAWW